MTADIIEFPFAKRRGALGFGTEPESNAGQFVAEIEELSRQWAARRERLAKQPIRRHLKIVPTTEEVPT